MRSDQPPPDDILSIISSTLSYPVLAMSMCGRDCLFSFVAFNV